MNIINLKNEVPKSKWSLCKNSVFLIYSELDTSLTILIHKYPHASEIHIKWEHFIRLTLDQLFTWKLHK